MATYFLLNPYARVRHASLLQHDLSIVQGATESVTSLFEEYTP